MGLCTNLKIAVPCCLGSAFLFGAIVLFVFGGFYYHQVRHKEVNYKEDICLVLTLGYRNYTCRTRYLTFNCCGAAWDVQLSRTPSINATAVDEKRYRSIDEALKETVKHQINTRASCWYDSRQPSVVQWKKPSSRIARILLICGGLSTAIMIFFVCLSIYFTPDDGRGLYMSTTA